MTCACAGCAAATCPACGKQRGKKVIAYGLPMRWCPEDGCHRVWGFWARALDVLPFNGHFLAYTGGYLRALWIWCTR